MENESLVNCSTGTMVDCVQHLKDTGFGYPEGKMCESGRPCDFTWASLGAKNIQWSMDVLEQHGELDQEDLKERKALVSKILKERK